MVTQLSNKQNIIERLAKNGGFRARINANCCECTYDEFESGTWRKQVENCTVMQCQLYPVRPLSLKGENQ